MFYFFLFDHVFTDWIQTERYVKLTCAKCKICHINQRFIIRFKSISVSPFPNQRDHGDVEQRRIQTFVVPSHMCETYLVMSRKNIMF